MLARPINQALSVGGEQIVSGVGSTQGRWGRLVRFASFELAADHSGRGSLWPRITLGLCFPLKFRGHLARCELQLHRPKLHRLQLLLLAGLHPEGSCLEGVFPVR